MTKFVSGTFAATVLMATLAVSGCGGGSSSAPNPPPPPPPPPTDLVRVSAASPFAVGCDGGNGQVYENAEVEPFVAVNPANPANIIGTWQQDRFASGGAHGLMAGVSFDGGETWKRHALPFSRCADNGNYARASDPWVTFSPNGIAYAISLSFTGGSFQPNSTSAILVTRSADGGVTWSDPVTLIQDGSAAFNDKESVTADPNDFHYVYAVWDRLTTANTGAAMFARTTDGGATWESARVLYDPGFNNQTLNNQIAVLPDGTVIDFFTEIDNAFQGTPSAFMAIVRSTDHGQTWSEPIRIAAVQAIGAYDPETGQTVRDGAFLGQIVAGPAGKLAVVWQDARFSAGTRDGILISVSGDGGLSWSPPAQINGDPNVQAFTPAVAILSDGTIGVSYYDFRDNTSDPAMLLTDYWLTRSRDGTNWDESRISGPFDLNLAPDAGGLFLGDYQGLASVDGMGFLPLFVQTNNDPANRTDVYTLPPGAVSAAEAKAVTPRALIAGATIEMTPEFRDRIQARLLELLREEIPWRGKTRPAPDGP